MNIIRCVLNKKYLLSALCIVLGASTLLPMDPPQQEREYVFVRTKDGAIIPVERWQISQMKTLLVLLEHQKGENDRQNPLNASMITSDELDMLKFALRASAEQVFEQYFMDLAKTDGLLEEIEDKGQKIKYTLGEGRVRALVNAAEKVEAQGIVALCGSYYLPLDMQKLLASHMIGPVIEYLKDRTTRSANENAFNIGSDMRGNKARCCAFSHDSKKIYVGFDTGKIEVWEISSKRLLNTFGMEGLRVVKRIALTSDDTMCAAELGIMNNTSGEIAIWDTSSGELLHKYPNNRGGRLIESMTFNPLNKNEIIFGYTNLHQAHLPPDAFCLNITNGSITPLRGYNEDVDTLRFSPDGTKVMVKPYMFLGNIAIWDAVGKNLIMNIRPRSATHCSSATFYGNEKIMVAGSSDFAGGQLIVEIGSINNNNYKVEKVFKCDRFFSPKKHEFGRYGFLAEPSFDGSRVALCCSYYMNAPEYDRFGNATPPGSLIHICKNDFSSTLFSTYLPDAGVPAVRWSPNDRWVAVTTTIADGKILLLQILSEKNEEILNRLSELSTAQARLLYQLYCRRLSGLRVGIKEADKDNAVFMEIPFEIRELLLKYLFYDRPSKKDEECIGNECVIL